MTKPSHIGALIVRKKENQYQVLLTKRQPDQEKFFLPGGRIEPNESELQVAARKISEETGIILGNPLADLGKISRPGRDDLGQKYVKTIRYYLYLLKDGAGPAEWPKRAEKEKVFYCFWKSLDDFNDLIHFPQEEQLVAIALRFLPQP